VNPFAGSNDIATFHDTVTTKIEMGQGAPMTALQNIGTMLPAALIALPAAYDQSGLRYVIPPVIQNNSNRQTNQNTGGSQ
jgi:hypothetical protein